MAKPAKKPAKPKKPRGSTSFGFGANKKGGSSGGSGHASGDSGGF